MTDSLPEPAPPSTSHAPADPDAALRRKNMIWGVALFLLVLLIFGASILIAIVYLALD